MNLDTEKNKRIHVVDHESEFPFKTSLLCETSEETFEHELRQVDEYLSVEH